MSTPAYTISYQRRTHDYDVLVEGQYIGSRETYADAEDLAIEHVSYLAQQTAIETADALADLAAEASTEAPLLVEPSVTECTITCPGCEACAIEPPTCPGTGLADCGAPVAVAGDFCQRCKDVLDKIFIAAMTDRALDTVRPAQRICPICSGDHDVQRCPRIWLKLRDSHVPAHIAALIHRVQTAPCHHSDPLVWEAERLYRLLNTLLGLAIGGDGGAWLRLMHVSGRAHTRLIRRMEAATAASKQRTAELNAKLGISALAA